MELRRQSVAAMLERLNVACHSFNSLILFQQANVNDFNQLCVGGAVIIHYSELSTMELSKAVTMLQTSPAGNAEGNSSHPRKVVIIINKKDMAHAWEKITATGATCISKPISIPKLAQVLFGDKTQREEVHAVSNTFNGSSQNPQHRITTPSTTGNCVSASNNGGDSGGPDHHAARILIVDDVVVNQKVLVMKLQQYGYQSLTVVSSGKEALECVTSNLLVFDIILMDVMMPGMDGLETTRKIRQCPGVLTMH